jgi:putative FmdB family regulatory protein
VPTYQYACTDCGHQLEAVQSFTDEALRECPVCQGRLRKVFNSVGIVFKGSGFYRTDSREKASSGSGTDTKDAGSSTSQTKDSKASDSKPKDGKPSSSDSSSGSSGKSSGKSSSTTGSAA